MKTLQLAKAQSPEFFNKPVKSLLSVSADSKTVKGEELGFLTGLVYLAPYTLSGSNVCPNAENAGCDSACLYSAGRGKFNNVQLSRLRKTELFHKDREAFMAILFNDIAKLIRKAKREGLTPVVRLNGTSDIEYQNIPVTIGQTTWPTIFEAFPEVQFYDYTKLPRKTWYNNYHLTFSYSGLPSYAKTVSKAIRLGMNMATVFASKDLPATFLGYPVINGDKSDLRFLDDSSKGPVIVGLYAKGEARKDQSGFVVHTSLLNNIIAIAA